MNKVYRNKRYFRKEGEDVIFEIELLVVAQTIPYSIFKTGYDSILDLLVSGFMLNAGDVIYSSEEELNSFNRFIVEEKLCDTFSGIKVSQRQLFLNTRVKKLSDDTKALLQCTGQERLISICLHLEAVV